MTAHTGAATISQHLLPHVHSQHTLLVVTHHMTDADMALLYPIVAFANAHQTHQAQRSEARWVYMARVASEPVSHDYVSCAGQNPERMQASSSMSAIAFPQALMGRVNRVHLRAPQSIMLPVHLLNWLQHLIMLPLLRHPRQAPLRLKLLPRWLQVLKQTQTAQK